MNVEIVSYKKTEPLPLETAAWCVTLRIEGIIEINFIVPLDIPEKQLATYIASHSEEILQSCKNIYGSTIVAPDKIAGIFLDLHVLKTKTP